MTPELTAHIKKWNEACQELEPKHGKSDAMLYVRGYVFGLNHAVTIASRSASGADNANPKCTHRQRKANQE